MSRKVCIPEIAELAEAHLGRRIDQPSLEELKTFYRKAQPHMAHKVLWFEACHRQRLADAVVTVVRTHKLTCYACAITANHIHILIRRHRIMPDELSQFLKRSGRSSLIAARLVPTEHPVFSADRCVIHKSTPESVRECIRYIRDNHHKCDPGEEVFPFISAYNNWPFHKRRGAPGRSACQ